MPDKSWWTEGGNILSLCERSAINLTFDSDGRVAVWTSGGDRVILDQTRIEQLTRVMLDRLGQPGRAAIMNELISEMLLDASSRKF